MKIFLSVFLVYFLVCPPWIASFAQARETERPRGVGAVSAEPWYQAVASPGGPAAEPLRAAEPQVASAEPPRAVISLRPIGAQASARLRYSGFGAVSMMGSRVPVFGAIARRSQTPSDEVESTPMGDEKFSLNTVADVEYAIGTGRGRAQKLEAMLKPKLNAMLPGGWKLTAVGRLRVDAFDELEPDRPAPQETSVLSRRAQIGDRSDAELRELYVEKTFGESYVKIGKQQVVWGESDGLKVLDLVNPQDFREFILPNFDESRIPLWAVNAEIPIKNWALQVIWVTDPSGHELAEPGSLYEVTSEKLVPKMNADPRVRVETRDLKRRKRLLKDSDVGFRLSTFAAGFDLTLNYLYRFDDFPVVRRTIDLADPNGASIRVRPEFERSTVVGGTLSKAFGKTTVRGELGYTIDRFLPVDDPGDRDGVTRVNDLSYVLGLDYFGISDTVLSAQFFQSLLSRPRSGLLRDRTESNATFVVRRDLMGSRLRLELIYLYGVNANDGLFRPEIRYELRDDLAIRAGLDIFQGSKEGQFGQFSKNDRFTFGVEVGF